MPLDIGDKHSVLFTGLSGFWQRFFKDTEDLEAFYQASELYLGQVYLDLLASILNIGILDTPIFNKEYWKLFTVKETELNFVQGASIAEDVFVYDMPGDIVSVDFLQNTIFDPEVLLERGVDFEVKDNDGIIRFKNDPFRGYQDENGNWLPIPGVGWRTVKIEVGNSFTDHEQVGNWRDTTDIKRGDSLRVLAHHGTVINEDVDGAIFKLGLDWYFTGTNVHSCKVGDVIQVYSSAAPDEECDGYYIVKQIDSLPPNQVMLETSGYMPSVASANPLKWNQYRMIYLESFADYEIDYFNKSLMVGSIDNPYPLDLKEPVVYSVVRDVYDPQVYGLSLPAIVTSGPPPTLPVPLPVPNAMLLGYRHIVPGSVDIHAVRHAQEGGLDEGVDYTIDYLRGIVYQLTYWKDGTVSTCDFQYQDEVFLAAGGHFSPLNTGSVKQISFWVPEVQVDRFNLWYNYGCLLNRFEASSEHYQAFLRGIMHLYMMGPILERIESALNVAAQFPVVKNDGEVLVGYDDGINASGTDGTITALTKAFNTPSFSFDEIDVGGYIVMSNTLSALNKGKFRILNIIDEHTVELETSYGFADETPVEWVLTRTYTKTVTTDKRTYLFPYYVPMRNDVQDSTNFTVLTFKAFESLTLAFTVTDYLEDPHWWHNKHIPLILWSDADRVRRHATDALYENVIGADDFPQIGDPGFFIGADEEGNVFAPNDNTGGPGTGDPVNLYRHNAAFLLFDRFLKMHMFFIEFDDDLELDSQFQDDLKELILVSKPSFQYPYVEPNVSFQDEITLTDLFNIVNFGFHWGSDLDGESDAMRIGKYSGSDIVPFNDLVIGDSEFPWNVGDYAAEVPFSVYAVPGAPPQVTPGYIFTVPGMLSGDHVLIFQILATVGGEPVLEGRDYTVNYLVEKPSGTPNPSAWQVEARTTWDPIVPLDVAWLGCNIVNLSTVPLPDTRLGYTPLAIGGVNPTYVRHTALDPEAVDFWTQWMALRSENIDYMLYLVIDADTGVPGGVPYTYL